MDTTVDIHNAFGLNWVAPSIGFGQFYFYEKNGVVHCDNENMSKAFIKTVLCRLVDECELTDPHE